jgi:hypothetical protein
MMKKKVICAVIFLLLVLGAAFIWRDDILRGVFSGYLARRLDADVEIARVYLDDDYNMRVESLRVRNGSGFVFHAGSGLLRLRALHLLSRELQLEFSLKDIICSCPDSQIINSVLEVLSLTRTDELRFTDARGELLCNPGCLSLRALYIGGELLKIDAYGITDQAMIDYSIKLSLSKELTSRMPGPINKIFFKQEGGWSNVDLQITGSADNPSIDFKTDLFTLSVD